MDPANLPVLPDLPDLPATGLSEKERRGATKLIKIPTMLRCLVGLTNKGYDLKMDDLDDEAPTRTWSHVSESVRAIIYLFSELDPAYLGVVRQLCVEKHRAMHATGAVMVEKDRHRLNYHQRLCSLPMQVTLPR